MANPFETNRRYNPEFINSSQQGEKVDFTAPEILHNPDECETEELIPDDFYVFESDGVDSLVVNSNAALEHHSNGNGKERKKGGHKNRHNSNAWMGGEKIPSGYSDTQRNSRGYKNFRSVMRDRPAEGADARAAKSARYYYAAVHGDPEE